MSESVSSKGWQIAEWVFDVLFGAQHGSQNPVKLLDKCMLLELPTEILLQMFSYLPLPSQVCLVLSSKTLHRTFGSVLASKELRFSQMPRNGRTYVVTEEYNLRMALLIKLQNVRWVCCGRCQKLHPRREFSAYQRKDCRPWERTCSEWAGIVDLYPCISLTLRERARIVEHLKVSEDTSLNLIKRGVLARDSHGQRLLHQCKAYSRIQIEMKLCLTESEQLTITTCYEGPNIIALPSREVDDQMLICCSKTWLDAMIPRDKPSWSCLNCHARIKNLSSPQSNAVIAHVVRFLGR